MKINNSIIAFFIVGFVSAQKVWSFNDCLSYARENNLQVLASKLNEQVQESNLKIAKKEKLPDLKGTITNGITFGPLATQKVHQDGMDNNRRLRLTEEKNSFLVQQNHYTTEKIKNDISLQLVGNYLTVLLNKELLGVQANSMDTQKQDKDRNEKLFKAGSIPLSTLYESRSNLANAKQTYENAKIEVDRSLMVLAMLLQKDYRDFQIEDVKVSDDIGMPLINMDDVINYAFNNQPVIKSAEIAVESAKKDIQENQLDQEKLNLKQNIQTSYFDVNSAFQTFNSAKELVSSTELSYEFAQKSFAAGKINIYDLNTARNNYYNALSQMLQAKYSFLFRLKILDFYIGKPLEISSNENENYNNLTPSKKAVQAINDLTTTEVEIKKPETLKPAISIPEKNNIKNSSTPIKPTNKKVEKAADTKSKETNTIKNEVKETTDKTISSANAKNKSKEIKAIPSSNKNNTAITTTPASPAQPVSKSEADAKREALIKERRLKYSQGAKPQFQNDTEREALIKERRAKLSKGI